MVKIGASTTLLAVMFVVASQVYARAEDSFERAKSSGVMFVMANEPPNQYMANGKPTGVSAEAIVSILHAIGINEVRGVQTEFGSIVPGIKAGRFDLGPAIYILPKRCEEVAFSEPLSASTSALLVQKGNPKNLHSYEDAAKSTNAIVAVMAGAVEQDYAHHAGVPSDRLLVLQDQGALLAAVKTGRADAVALTRSVIKGMAAKAGDSVEMANPFNNTDYTTNYTGMPFRKEDTSLREAFNAGLKEFKTTAAYRDMLEKADQSDPGDMTTAKRCSK